MSRFSGQCPVVSCIQASFKSPQLIGKGGAERRYLKIQWWILFWRLLILLWIPEALIFNPGLVASTPYALTVLTVAGTYAVLYFLVSTRTGAAGSRCLHGIDLTVCSFFMFMGHHDPAFVFIMAYYAASALVTRPNTVLWRQLAAAAFLTIAYLGANAAAGLSPEDFFAAQDIFANRSALGTVIIFYFWALGFAAFSAVLDHVSSLELDDHLEKQRLSYRRRLHDDLGNILCGLHFKIQSLKNTRSEELERGLGFLTAGYEQANRLLRRLLFGVIEPAAGNLSDSLTILKEEVEADSGVRVELSLPAGRMNLSPEVETEVLYIVQEAVFNTVRHANVEEVFVRVGKSNGRLRVKIVDRGAGFDDAARKSQRTEAGMGLQGMRERANLINGHLNINSRIGAGTTVDLAVETLKTVGNLISLAIKRRKCSCGALYTLGVRFKTIILVWTFVQLILAPDLKFSLPLLVVSAAILADGLVFQLFCESVYGVLEKRPWLMMVEQLMFALLFYISLQTNTPIFFAMYIGVSILMAGCFLGITRGAAMTILLSIGILIAFLLAPADNMHILEGKRVLESLEYFSIHIIIVISAGLAAEFVAGLEKQQQAAIGRALARQQEQLTAETHRQLYTKVLGVRKELHALRTLDAGSLGHLEEISSDLKTRLNEILKSLDESGGKAAASQAA